MCVARERPTLTGSPATITPILGTADHIAFLTLMTLILLPTVSMVVKAGLEPVEDSDRLVL